MSSGSISINYIKSSDYKEALCDGAIGSLGPNDKFFLACYVDRAVIPQVVEHPTEIDDDSGIAIIPVGAVGEVTAGKEGIARILNFGVYLTRDGVESLHNTLTQLLNNTKEGINEDVS